MSRMKTWLRSVAIIGSGLLFLALPIDAQPQGYLRVDADPGRAGVFVDGNYVGPAENFGLDRTYAVSAGEHEVTLKEPRYKDVTIKVTVEAGKTVKISERMQPVETAMPPFGVLRTQGDKYSAVYVNDMYMGHVDEFNNFSQGLLLNPGEYTVRIAPVNGTPHEEKVTIRQDQTTIVRQTGF